MGRPPRVNFDGAIFHAYTRGNAGQRVFYEHDDWLRFIRILSDLKRERPFRLYAYCLMTNHVHLLLEPLRTPLSKLMSLLLTRYATYLNARKERTGHVFQSRYKARLCTRDSHLQELVRYIHLNPVRAGMVDDPISWPYSGHSQYLSQQLPAVVDRDLVLSMFGHNPDLAREAYAQFLMNNVPEDIKALCSMRDTPSARPPDSACKQASETLEADRERRSLETLAGESVRQGGIPMTLLHSASRSRSTCEVRRRFVWHAFRAGYTPTETAAYLSITVSAVSRILARAQVKQVN